MNRSMSHHLWILSMIGFILFLNEGFLFAQTNWTIIGWNNLGMHCMDSDYSIFSILPPYNTIHAQLINNQGKLVTNTAGIGVSYHAISDLEGSVNRSSQGKGNFWRHAQDLFGLSLAEDTGLPVPGPESFHMPGSNNIPQAMKFEPGMNWFTAYGIPISPYDDAGKPNQYPMMRLMATNSAGSVLAMTDIVLPVSDEMDCRLCHASGTGPDAEPVIGWVWESDPGRDYRLNILRLHDQNNLTNPVYVTELAARGFHTNGLFAHVTINQQPVLCASCHLSEALPGSGADGIPPLTAAIHGHHAEVIDPRNGMTLDASANRVSCYSCHPGSETRCLRGAMGKAVAPDGTMMMQCQSCHGNLSEVGRPDRTGWLDEPNCQACHVGNAINAFGVIRFADAFTNGVLRVPADTTFATTPHTPATNVSLYRFSTGHGGLQCSACHGSTHAEYPSALPADNVANIERQGHAGVLHECTACHQTMPTTRNGGPHGMHQIGQSWINDHNNAAQALGLNACRSCHGQNGEGTVLSLAFSEKTVTSERGNVHYWRGRKVTCYGCHNGMNTGDPTTRGVPTLTNISAVATSGIPRLIALSGPNTRIVDQARHGVVALSGTVATYYPDPTYAGTDSFTFAVHNGYNESELGTATIEVAMPPGGYPAFAPAWLFGIHANGSNASFSFASQLGQAYRVEATTDLVHAQPHWETVVDQLWGRTDSTLVPDQLVFDYMRCFRVASIPDPPIPVVASDLATNLAYNSGWNQGANDGIGFGPWNLVVSNGANAGFIIATTSALGNVSMPIRAWGLWANSGSSASAFRDLNQPLAVGDALALRFDNNFIQNGGQAGVGFLNAGGQVLAELFFIGGQATYRVNDRAGSRLTSIPWSGQGWDLVFRIAADGEYHLRCGEYIVPGLLKDQADQAVARIRMWNANAGSGSDFNVYADQLRVEKP